MKTIIRTLFTVLAVSLTLASCITDSQILSDRYGVVQVEIAENAGSVTRSDGETMETIRLIVFTDLATAPRAESNQLFRLSDGDFEIIPSTSPGVPSKVRFTLKVLRKSGATAADKILIVAVINEPVDNEPGGITATLSNPDVTIEELETLEIDIATFVSSDHLSLKNGATIPMTGALWTDYTRLLQQSQVPSHEPLELVVHRAIARVDVYLKRETVKVDQADVVLDPDLKMTTGTTITLDRTYDHTNLIMSSDGTNTLGTIPTVATADYIAPRSWSVVSGEQAVAQYETIPVCVFYTPERNCVTDAERLKLSVNIKTPEGTTRNGELTIKEAKDKEGVTHTVNKVERNHIYKVTVTITANGITGIVDEWDEIGIGTDF